MHRVGGAGLERSAGQQRGEGGMRLQPACVELRRLHLTDARLEFVHLRAVGDRAGDGRVGDRARSCQGHTLIFEHMFEYRKCI